MSQTTVMQTPLINTGVSVGTKSGINTTSLILQNSVPWTNINLSDNQNAKGTPKPIDAPSGTKPIDNVGLPRDVIHDIKNDIGARPNDWTGVTPNGASARLVNGSSACIVTKQSSSGVGPFWRWR